MPLTMAAGAAWLRIADEFFIAPTDIGAILFGPIAPTAQADHLIVFGPVGK